MWLKVLKAIEVLRDRDNQTSEPGWSSPNMEPGLGQWALTTAPSTSAMSERNLLGRPRGSFLSQPLRACYVRVRRFR